MFRFRILLSFSVLVFALLIFVPVASAEEDTSNSSIDTDYQIGETLTSNELNAIRDSIRNNQVMGQVNTNQYQPAGKKSWSFFGTKRNSKYKVEGDVSGTLTSTLGFFNHKSEWEIKARGRGPITESRARGTIEGYGVAGSDGTIGKIIDTSVSSGWRSGKTANYTGSKAFTGAVVYVRYQAYGNFKHSGGTLTAIDTYRHNN